MTSKEAYRFCEKICRDHYENFPLGWFLPRKLKNHLFALYAFARTADDYSDEEKYKENRLEPLQEHQRKLEEAVAGRAEDPLFFAVSETLRQTGLSPDLLRNLLKAFLLDLTKKRYRNYPELENYCVYSANPVGRMVLHLFGVTDPELLTLSDKICTGIQLVNHWQDIAIDLEKDRIYLPEEDLHRFGYRYEDLFEHRVNDPFRHLMRFETARTRDLFYAGKPLLKKLSRKLRLPIALMWRGPMEILKKMEKIQFDIFKERPILAKREKLKLLLGT